MNIGIVGVTGAVGNEMLNCINNLKLKFNNLKLFASEKSEGKQIKFCDKLYTIECVNENSFDSLDIVLFGISSELSKKYFKYAKNSNCLVIDNSSAFRMNDKFPLIIPEINPNKIYLNNGLIANPNCSTILMNLVLWNIYKKYGLERIIVSTYQAASGAGNEGINELLNQSKNFSRNLPIDNISIFGRQYIWNVFSHNSNINLENGYNEEELKMINETKKIFNNNNLNISATCVRVPVLRAHSESINITLSKKANEKDIRDILNNTKGVKVLDDRKNNIFPEPINTSGKYDVYVGRIRKDIGQKEGYGFELFISGDQILKGAALNAVQILQIILNDSDNCI